MNDYLCPQCGNRINDTMKTCPMCNTLNYRNPDTLERMSNHNVRDFKKWEGIANGCYIMHIAMWVILSLISIGTFISLIFTMFNY